MRSAYILSSEKKMMSGLPLGCRGSAFKRAVAAMGFKKGGATSYGCAIAAEAGL
jgi:hypothetical protein